MEENPFLKSAILEIVDNQLRANDPPETRQTFDLLISEGYSEKEANKLIGCVVVQTSRQCPTLALRAAKQLNATLSG